MTILNPTAQRDAKRAELEHALAAARDEFTEAQESHRAAKMPAKPLSAVLKGLRTTPAVMLNSRIDRPA